MRGRGLDSSGFLQGLKSGFCVYGTKPSGYTKYGLLSTSSVTTNFTSKILIPDVREYYKFHCVRNVSCNWLRF